MKQLLTTFTLLWSMVIIPCNADTIRLTLDPLSDTIVEGSVGIVTLRVSGLTLGGPDSLGAFRLEINYDKNVLDLDVFTASNWLGNPEYTLDPNDPLQETYYIIDRSTPGVILFTGQSFLDAFELDALQIQDNFVLGAMSFRGIAAGRSSALSFGSQFVFVDALGNIFDPITEVELVGSSIFVVPEPAAYLLFISGLAGLIFIKRRKLPTR